MSLDKSIEAGDDWRTPYRTKRGKIGKANSKSTRNHGSDPAARANRLYRRIKEEMSVEEELNGYVYTRNGWKKDNSEE